MTTVVTELRANQIGAVSLLLAAAFDDDPAYRALFPNASSRPPGLTDLFARNLRTHLPHRCSYVLSDGDDVVATVTVRPPGGIPISLSTMLRRGLIPFGVRHGLSSVKRLIALKGLYDRLEADVANGMSHRLVHMMAVSPHRQGRGLGAELLRAALERSAGAKHAASLPVLLTTHSPRNVTFYERHGFRVCERRDISPASRAYPVWIMKRTPDS
jgi:GNAT superfamily N-acetyltransferase